MQTTVYTRNPTTFNMYGQSHPNTLKEVDGVISTDLCEKLLAYSLATLDSAGFKDCVTNWTIEIYTLDGDEEDPEERTYCTRWLNTGGGYIEVIGIFIRDGVPWLDHGLAVGY